EPREKEKEVVAHSPLDRGAQINGAPPPPPSTGDSRPKAKAPPSREGKTIIPAGFFDTTAWSAPPISSTSADQGRGVRQEECLRVWEMEEQAAAAPVVLNRRDVINQGPDFALPQTTSPRVHPMAGDMATSFTAPEANSEAVTVVEDEDMGVSATTVDPEVTTTATEQLPMEVEEPMPLYVPPSRKSSAIPAKAYPGKAVWRPPTSEAAIMSTSSRPRSFAPGDFVAEPAPEPGNEDIAGTNTTASGRPGPDPAPKKARGPVGDTRPLAIVVPNGEALWFTTRDIDEDTPRLVIPWSLFQYIAMSLRPLSGFQSWGRVGVVCIRRVAQDIIHGAQQRYFMDRIKEVNLGNPWLLDLNSYYPEPSDAETPMSASTGAHRPNFNFRDFLQRPGLGQHFHPGEEPPRPGRGQLPCIYDQPRHEMPLAAFLGEADHASNCMGMWARRLLGQETPTPPPKGVPPKAASGATASASTAGTAPEEDDEESDMELTAEERAEVARIEEECSELERRMRNLSSTQQRSLLENLANTSSAVMGGLLADTVRRTAQLRGKGALGGGRPKVKHDRQLVIQIDFSFVATENDLPKEPS
ncbi:unnamed protein product, partial [Symbiodinium microadriaticum]